jgi:hypothetical protein
MANASPPLCISMGVSKNSSCISRIKALLMDFFRVFSTCLAGASSSSSAEKRTKVLEKSDDTRLPSQK